MSIFCNANLAEINRECSSSMGGIREVLVLNRGDIGEVELGKNEDVVDIISVDPDFGSISLSDGVFFRFEDQTSSLDTEIVVDEDTGTSYCDITLSLEFARQDMAKRKTLNNLRGKDLTMLVRDNNDEVWLIGDSYPIEFANSTANTGTAFGDSNGYSIVFKGFSKNMPLNATVFYFSELSGDGVEHIPQLDEIDGK